ILAAPTETSCAGQRRCYSPIRISKANLACHRLLNFRRVLLVLLAFIDGRFSQQIDVGPLRSGIIIIETRRLAGEQVHAAAAAGTGTWIDGVLPVNASERCQSCAGPGARIRG